MNHSIIIPHRDRLYHLQLCVHSIAASAVECGVEDYEIIVVENGSYFMPMLRGAVRVINDCRPMMVFNKPKLQNVGMDHATGNVLSFLDADAIVGPRWMGSTRRLLEDTMLTKVCYDVAYLPVEISCRAGTSDQVDMDILRFCRDVFGSVERYDELPSGFEARVQPDWPLSRWMHLIRGNRLPEPLFGNSQFSILRDKLGDLRFDEGYEGAGYEDIAMNRAIWRKFGKEYRAEMPSDPAENLLHLTHRMDTPGWRVPSALNVNVERYRRT